MKLVTDPTTFSYSVMLNTVQTINFGPHTGSHLHNSGSSYFHDETFLPFSELTGSLYLTLAPTLLSHVGTWPVWISVCSGSPSQSTKYTFTIRVKTLPPVF